MTGANPVEPDAASPEQLAEIECAFAERIDALRAALARMKARLTASTTTSTGYIVPWPL